MATVNLGAIKFNWKGAYNNSTAYVVDDVVSSSGSSYVCILASQGNAVSNGTYWNIMSSAGTNGTNGTDLTSTLTTQGDILYRDGSGLQRLPKGTAGQVLQMNSGATAPEYGTVSSDYVKILTTTTSGTTVTLNNIFTSDYHFYQVFIDSYNSANSTNLGMRVLVGGAEQQGSDYIFGGTYVNRASGSASTGTDSGWNDTYAKVANGSGDASKRTSGLITCYNPTNSSNHKQFTYQFASWNDTNTQYNYDGGITARFSSALTGLSFKFHGSGTMTLGRVSVYGLKI